MDRGRRTADRGISIQQRSDVGRLPRNMLREQKAARRVSPGPARSAPLQLKSRLQSRSQFCPPPGSGVGQPQGDNPGTVWGNNDRSCYLLQRVLPKGVCSGLSRVL